MTKPYPCPQPEPCAYCPGGPTTGSPQSYTGHEPAAMRGGQNNYDPYLQVRSRIDQLTAIGHTVDKIELIIMGGTFPATPPEYQSWFIQRCLDAITGKESAKSARGESERGEQQNPQRRNHRRNPTRLGETAPHRRHAKDGRHPHRNGRPKPRRRNIPQSRQSTHCRRREEATHIVKDAGLKIVYHMMPGLPGSNRAKDLEAFKRIFTNPAFKPDMIKIYPCLVIDGTKTHQWYEQGTYKPYSTAEASSLIADVKRIIPPWIRIMRVQRDIPARLIVAGVKKATCANCTSRISAKLRTMQMHPMQGSRTPHGC